MGNKIGNVLRLLVRLRLHYYIEDLQAKTKSKAIPSQDLMPFFSELLNGPENGK